MGFLKTEVRPDVVSLPNLMFIGMADAIRRKLDCPVICELTGEDIFLDAMRPADQAEMQQVIRSKAKDITRFVATCTYYADRMAAYLAVPRERISVVFPGVPRDYLKNSPEDDRSAALPPTVGYVARICPEKGLGRLIDGMEMLVQRPGMADVRLEAGGYLGSRDHAWFNKLQARVAASRLAGKVAWPGELTREQKLELPDRSDVFSVPSIYAEPKGIFVLESLARGVPVVQPAHGSFPELIEKTGGGLLVPPGNPDALADALATLLSDKALRKSLGAAGQAAVAANFTDDHMAANMIKVYQQAMTALPSTSQSAPVSGLSSVTLYVNGISKSFATPAEPLVVLKGVTFSLTAGESLAIVGPSGSGKSTLLSILGTWTRRPRGEVILDGYQPFRPVTKRPCKVSQPKDRLRLPGPSSSTATDGFGERPRRPARVRADRQGGQRLAPPICFDGLDCRTDRRTFPPSSPAGMPARCHCPGVDEWAATVALRRADRQSRRPYRHRDRRPAIRAGRGISRDHDRGDAQPRLAERFGRTMCMSDGELTASP